MSTLSLGPGSGVATTRYRSSPLLSGPRFPILLLAALPAAVVALACEGLAQRLSALIAVGWFSLVPVALYNGWVARALPAVAAVFLAITLAAFPLRSPPLTVDVWTSVVLLVLSLPPSARASS